MHPLGGHIGSEGDGLGPKQPELFDIHVMLFAGDPESTIDGLERYFAIDREAAERLMQDVPVVVKRAAEPNVAAEMVDVLGELGAQVVLLPAASAVPPETDLLELKAPSHPPAHGELDFDEQAEQSTPQVAGGLEWSDDARERHARARARGAEAWGGLDHNPRRAATADLLASAPMAELDLDPPAVDEPIRSRAGAHPLRTAGQYGGEKSLLARGPARASPQRTVRIAPTSEPPVRGVETDDGLVIAPLYEPHEREQARARGAPTSRSYGNSLPPALRGDGESLLPAPPPARPPTPPSGEAHARVASGGDPRATALIHAAASPTASAQALAADLGLGSVPPLPDLGLGVVPRLPINGPPVPTGTGKSKARVPPPPPGQATAFEMPRPSRRPPGGLGVPPQTEAQRGLYERTLDDDAALKLPSLTGAQAVEPRAGAARPAQADGYWSGRRAAADAGDASSSAAEPDASPGAAAHAGSHAGSQTGIAHERALPTKPASATRPSNRPKTVRAVGGPLIELVAGLAVFVVGMMQDNSVMFGNASILSVLLHGIALYGIGAGLAGLRG